VCICIWSEEALSPRERRTSSSERHNDPAKVDAATVLTSMRHKSFSAMQAHVTSEDRTIPDMVLNTTENECELSRLIKEKETLTKTISEDVAQYRKELTKIEHKMSSVAGHRMYDIEKIAHKVGRPISMVFGEETNTGLHFPGRGDFAQRAQKLMEESIIGNWHVQHLMFRLQTFAKYPRAQGPAMVQCLSRTPQIRPCPTLSTFLRNGLHLNNSGFESVATKSLVVSGTARTNTLGKNYVHEHRSLAIETEQHFFLTHLLRWLQLKYLETVPEFKELIPKNWFSTKLEDAPVTGRLRPKNFDLKKMANMFHTAVTNLPNPNDQVKLLRQRMRMFLFFSMPSKRQGDKRRTDLQRMALENRISDQIFYKNHPDPWLERFKNPQSSETKSSRGFDWPGDIGLSSLPTVLVSLLLILHKGHIFVLDDFEPEPSSSVPQICEHLKKRLAQEHKEEAYAKLNLADIMQEMDKEVLFFLSYLLLV